MAPTPSEQQQSTRRDAEPGFLGGNGGVLAIQIPSEANEKKSTNDATVSVQMDAGGDKNKSC